MSPKKNPNALSFGEHLEELRQMLFRILAAVMVLAIAIFCFKDKTFELLLAPSRYDFITYRLIEKALHAMGSSFVFNEFHVNLIATELSSQFMTHVTAAFYLGFLLASPYILYELFRFVTPALYEKERKYSVRVAIIVYLLFVVGVLMSYFILFPISFRFLGTYSVSEVVESNKIGAVKSDFLKRYRKHALVIIMVVAAIITPPDLMTLVLVTIPLYLLYEVSISILKRIEKTNK